MDPMDREMDCERLRGVLMDHVDGLLGREDAYAARAHLAACAECRRLQEEVRRNFSALDAWEDEDLPAGAFDRLLARVPAGPRALGGIGAPLTQPRGSRQRVLLYAAGLAAAAAVAGFLVLPRGSAPSLTAPGLPGRPSNGVATAAPAAPTVAKKRALRPGERALSFPDYDHNVLREVRLPEGVDPASVELIKDERPVVVPPGGVR